MRSFGQRRQNYQCTKGGAVLDPISRGCNMESKWRHEISYATLLYAALYSLGGVPKYSSLWHGRLDFLGLYILHVNFHLSKVTSAALPHNLPREHFDLALFQESRGRGARIMELGTATCIFTGLMQRAGRPNNSNLWGQFNSDAVQVQFNIYLCAQNLEKL